MKGMVRKNVASLPLCHNQKLTGITKMLGGRNKISDAVPSNCCTMQRYIAKLYIAIQYKNVRLEYVFQAVAVNMEKAVAQATLPSHSIHNTYHTSVIYTKSLVYYRKSTHVHSSNFQLRDHVQRMAYFYTRIAEKSHHTAYRYLYRTLYMCL